MPTQVKVCGITRREDAAMALSLGADYLGFIVYPKSPRCVDLAHLPALLESAPPGKRVIVDVAPSAERFERLLGLGADYYQIHFDLEIAMATLAGWSARAGPASLWLAPRIPEDEEHFPQIIMEFADTLLIDAFDRSAYGGTGRAGENWQRFLDCTLLYQHKKWVLAGGLSPANIADALRFTQAEIVDTNSGVESSPGVKDPGRLRQFFDVVKQYDRERDDS